MARKTFEFGVTWETMGVASCDPGSILSRAHTIWAVFPLREFARPRLKGERGMTFDPTPKNSTIDGLRWPKNSDSYIHWDQMDWTNKVWREKATIMVACVGYDSAPDDPHWNVPHKNGETWHRVREKATSRPAARRAEKEGG